MISVVFSTRGDNPKHIEHIKNTSGIHKGLEVKQYINNGEYSLTELYNKALKETTNNIVVFCHDDIIFDTKNWGKKLLKVMEKNPEYHFCFHNQTSSVSSGYIPRIYNLSG